MQNKINENNHVKNIVLKSRIENNKFFQAQVAINYLVQYLCQKKINKNKRFQTEIIFTLITYSHELVIAMYLLNSNKINTINV